MSTTPDNTTSCVLPSGPTSTSQSVPRMPIVAVAVVRRTRCPVCPGIVGGRARLQMRPVTSRSTDTTRPEGSAAELTSSWLFWFRRICVRSAMTSASWLFSPVRTIAPGGIFCETPIGCQAASATSRRSPLPTSMTISAPLVAA
jgi:hypothetical protein